VIGAAAPQGQVVWAALLLAMFALGFSLPLGAVFLGVSLGKTSLGGKKVDCLVRWAAGPILIVAGFYFLIKF